MCEVEVADEILDLEGVVYYGVNLLLVPFFKICVLKLPSLLCHLLEDACIVAQRVGYVLEMKKPETSLEAELVEQKWAEVDVEMAVGVDG